MKDPIVQESHRHRAEYTKRFNDDIAAIGRKIRRCETKSGGKFAATMPRHQHYAGTKSAKTARLKSPAMPK
jgi:hypothetical protein